MQDRATTRQAQSTEKPLFVNIDSLPRALRDLVDLEMERMNLAPTSNGRIQRMISPQKLPGDDLKKAEEKRRLYAWLLEEMKKAHEALWARAHTDLSDFKEALDNAIDQLKNPKTPAQASELNALKKLRDIKLPKLRNILKRSTADNMGELKEIHEEIESATSRYRTLGKAYNAVKAGTKRAFRASGHGLAAGTEATRRAAEKLKTRAHRHIRGRSKTPQNPETRHVASRRYDDYDSFDLD